MLKPTRREFLESAVVAAAIPGALTEKSVTANRPGPNLCPGPKFWRGHRVRICDEMPRSMAHFPCGCEAVVVKGNVGQRIIYNLLLDLPTGSNSVSWYDECQLTLVSEDRDDGERLIQRYDAGYRGRQETRRAGESHDDWMIRGHGRARNWKEFETDSDRRFNKAVNDAIIKDLNDAMAVLTQAT